MRPTPRRTDDRPAEGIRQAEMSAAEERAVAQAMATHLEPRLDEEGRSTLAPIVPGDVRASRSGALWVRFADGDRWYRLMDAPSTEESPGGRVVWDAQGRPLGSIEGPLLLTEVRGRPVAVCANTGWNYEHEIVWPGETP